MLTPSAVTNAKPRARAYKLSDERGMYLLVKPASARWWRFDDRRPDMRKRTAHLTARRKRMQSWADYLGSLRMAPGKVVRIKRKTS